MKRILALFISVSCFGVTQAYAQPEADTLPNLPTVEITPELFPTPVPTPSAVESVPSDKPIPSSNPTEQRPSLSYEFPKLTEGRSATLKLKLNSAYLRVQYPVRGRLVYDDLSYDQSKKSTETIAFEIPESGRLDVPVVFRTPGKKKIRIETDLAEIPTRNILAYIEPFSASIFPRTFDDRKWSKDPKDWHVWVNLYTDYRGQQSQRQYYLVTYKGEIMQKLLTSGAAPGMVTPQGKFKLGSKMAAPRSTKYASLMPFWSTIRIPGYTFEYGNHGLVGESYLYRLGTPASHGCLRLSNKWIQTNGKRLNIGGAKWVYHHVPVGTPIHIFRRAIQPFAFESYSMWLARRN